MKCQRADCRSDKPEATYVFTLEGDIYDPEDYGTEVHYCTDCVAFCIKQDYFDKFEVDSLHKL